MSPRFRLAHARTCFIALIVGGTAALTAAAGQPLYRFDDNRLPRWSSPENPNGAPGQAAQANHGAKGRPSVRIPAGATHQLLNYEGAGEITRIWLTVMDRSPKMLRSLKLEMFWDGAARPAVSVPLGDFFCVGLGRTAKFHNALFASPEGRSFVCLIPMPFRTGARIQITNEAGWDLTHLFYDVDFVATPKPADNDLYFHAYWHRDPATKLGQDFELLPRIEGRGRYLGVSVGVNANPVYQDTWWGEGEVKVYLDGDQQFPTLAGTGAEDYIGTGWGQGEFFNDYTGSVVADDQAKQWSFYRLHLPDPIYFKSACRITLQQIGSTKKETVAALQNGGAPLIPTSLDTLGTLRHLYQPGQVSRADDPSLGEGYMNFYRSDDVSATAYFYLASPTSDLPPLQPVAERTADLRAPKS